MFLPIQLRTQLYLLITLTQETQKEVKFGFFFKQCSCFRQVKDKKLLAPSSAYDACRSNELHLNKKHVYEDIEYRRN